MNFKRKALLIFLFFVGFCIYANPFLNRNRHLIFDSKEMLNFYGSVESRGNYQEKPIKDVWLYTFGSGNELWSFFGHSRFVVEFVDGTCSYFDWGIWNPNYSGFKKDFVQGRLFYENRMYSNFSIEDCYIDYINTGRSVKRQKLILNQEKKQDLYYYLIWSTEENNKIYNYEFFTDNCSTRPRDIINVLTEGQLEEVMAKNSANTTYRREVNNYLPYDPLISWALNFLLGSWTDKKITKYDNMFLPKNLSVILDEFYEDKEEYSGIEIVSEESNLPKINKRASEDLGLIFSAVIGFINIVLLLGCLIRKKPFVIIFAAINTIFLLLLFGLGSILYTINFFSLHLSSWQNLNLLFANPFIVFLIISMWFSLKSGVKTITIKGITVLRNIFIWSAIYLCLTVLSILLGFIVPQYNWFIALPFLVEYLSLVVFSAICKKPICIN